MVKVFSTYSCPQDQRVNKLNNIHHSVTSVAADNDATQEATTKTVSREPNGEGDDEDSVEEQTTCCFGISGAVDKYKADTEDITLSEHLRCCLHILNLTATTDTENYLKNKAYKKLYRQPMAKLWLCGK